MLGRPYYGEGIREREGGCTKERLMEKSMKEMQSELGHTGQMECKYLREAKGGILNEQSMGARMSLQGHEPAMPHSPFFIGIEFSDRVVDHKMKRLIMARWQSPESSTHDKFQLLPGQQCGQEPFKHKDGMLKVGILEDDWLGHRM